MMDKNEFFITTIDNPFNPFTRFDDWYNYDTDFSHPYNTLAYWARIANNSTELSQFDQNRIMENAIDEIIKESPMKIYRKVRPNDTFKYN